MEQFTITSDLWAKEQCPFPFLGDELQSEAVYKVYCDGGHYVATPLFHSQVVPSVRFRNRDELAAWFDVWYADSVAQELTGDAQRDHIVAGIAQEFPNAENLEEYVSEHIERKTKNYYKRLKRFRRKAHLNRWNYFVTFTYDDEKQSEETFRKRLRRCLSNLASRRGWRYMGVFERAPEKGRLHFHGLLYVPCGEMVGEITERKDYSTERHEMVTTHPNSFFEKRFGRCDFDEVDDMELRVGNTLNYLLKYIGKTGERIVYSRGIASEICLRVSAGDIATNMFDYVPKFVLFDDVVDWERDVMGWRRKVQMSMFRDLRRRTAA